MRVLAFLYPGAECWNHFHPIAQQLHVLGHTLVVADFTSHTPSVEDRPLDPMPARIALSDQWEGAMGRMDRRTYLKLHGEDIDFAANGLFYPASEGYPHKRMWLFLDSPFYQRLYALAHRIGEVLDLVAPDIVIVAHGANALPSVAVAKSRVRGISTLVFESSFFPEHVVLDPDGAHFLPGMNRLDRQWPLIKDRALSPEQETELDEKIGRWQQQRQSKYAQSDDPGDLRRWQAFVNDARRSMDRIVFVPEQIPWDANVVLGLTEYASWNDFAASVVRHLPRDCRIVYKAHPKRREADATFLPNHRLLAVNDLSIHTLFSSCDAVCTFSSNVGFEALLSGLPVLTGGLPHYGTRGFTHRLTKAGISQLPDFSPGEERLFRRYAWHVLFEYLLPATSPGALARRLAEASEPRLSTSPPQAPFAAAFFPRAEPFLAEMETVSRRISQTQIYEGLADVDPFGLTQPPELFATADAVDSFTRQRYALASALVSRGSRVLDAGCGCGYGAHEVAAKTGAKVVAVDPHPAALDFAAKRWNHPDVTWESCSITAFLERDQLQVDAALCFGVTEYLPDDERVLRSLWDRLAPNGILIVSFANAAEQRLENPAHVRHRTPQDIRQLLQGFDSLQFLAVLGQRLDGSLVKRAVGPFVVAVAQKASLSGQPGIFAVRFERALESLQ